MEDNNKVTQYLIPANVSTRFEFFEGFGWEELKLVVIALIVGAFFFFNLGFIKKTIEIDPKDITIEQKIGADEEKFKLNKNGKIEKTIPLIPTPVRIFCIIIPGALMFFYVKKDPSNGMSLREMLKSAREFKSRQKLYLYKYNSGSEG